MPTENVPFATTEPTYYQSDQEEIRRRAMMPRTEDAEAKAERLEARIAELEATLREIRILCVQGAPPGADIYMADTRKEAIDRIATAALKGEDG